MTSFAGLASTFLPIEAYLESLEQCLQKKCEAGSIESALEIDVSFALYAAVSRSTMTGQTGTAEKMRSLASNQMD